MERAEAAHLIFHSIFETTIRDVLNADAPHSLVGAVARLVSFIRGVPTRPKGVVFWDDFKRFKAKDFAAAVWLHVILKDWTTFESFPERAFETLLQLDTRTMKTHVNDTLEIIGFAIFKKTRPELTAQERGTLYERERLKEKGEAAARKVEWRRESERWLTRARGPRPEEGPAPKVEEEVGDTLFWN